MTVLELWLPILLAAILVFVVSSIVHMVLPYHRADYKGLPGEDGVLAAMRDAGVSPGHFVFPHAADTQCMGTPEFQARLDQGPVGFITVLPNGGFGMGKSLVQWFLYTIVVGACVAYISAFHLDAGAASGDVFRTAATVGIFGYALSYAHDSIWKGLSWSISMKFAFDGILYGLTTGAAFMWTWPSA